MKTKITCLVLTLCLLLSAMPIMSFASGEAPQKDYYQKITSTSQMAAGAQYLIASAWENYVLDGSLGEDMDSANNHIEVDIENDRIEATDELDAAAFEINVSAGTIKSVSGYYIGSAESLNSIEISETSDFVNEISFDNGEFVVGHQGTKDYFALQFNDQSGQKRFRFYKNAGQTPIELYMRVDVPVPYVDASGTAQTPVSDYTTLSSGVTEWTNGWYILKSDVTFGERVAVKGDNVNLILCDGKTLTVNGGVLIEEGCTLTIWAQQAGTGKLIAIGSSRSGFESAGIGSSWELGSYTTDENATETYHTGDLTVNGGVIEATGGHYCAGIGGSNGRRNGTVTINGGSVTAVGGKEAAGIGGGKNSGRGTVAIYGGVVDATGGSYGSGIGGGRNGGRVEITIAGGTVTAHGGSNAAAIGASCDGGYDSILFTGGVVDVADGRIGGNGCSIRFSYTEPGYGMRVAAKSYGGPVTFEKPFTSLENPKYTFSGHVSRALNNQTLYPKTAGVWNVSFDQNGGTGSMNSLSVIGGPYTLPECDFTAPSTQQPFAGWSVKVGEADSIVKQPGEQALVSADTTVKAIWADEFTVSFDNGGGSGSMAAVTLGSCETYTLPANGFTAPTGKHFYGWQVTHGIDSPKTMQPGDTLTVTDDTVVQALWTVSITSWAQLQSVINDAPSGETIALGQSLTALSSDNVLTVSGNKSITLDLNGFTLDRACSSTDADGHVIIVYPPATLTIKDSSGDNSGCITGGWATNGGGINNQSVLNIEGGTITGNKATNGGAICNRAAMTIAGGVITDNTATGDGGSIWNEGTASLSSLTVTNHTGAQNGGAIANFNAGTMTVNGCVISGNAASDLGGAICVDSGSLTVTDSELSGNTSGDGGAIYNTAGNTVTLTDASLHNNKTTQHGGGAITNYGTADLTDCELWQNEAFTRGGAIWCGIDDSASLSLSDCAVSANTASLDGGGICVNKGTLTMSGTTVNGNSANDGGGLFINENVTAQLGGEGNLFYDNVCPLPAAAASPI